MTLYSLGRWLLGRDRSRRGDCISGSASIIFAIALVPLLVAVSVAVDFSRLADGRATLQRAVDNAALSGAAAFAVNSPADYTRALVMATSTFCQTTAALPVGLAVVAIGGTSQQSCGTAAGPTVASQVAGYKAGTPGITASSCSATNTVVAGVNCGFIVTVSAQVSINTILPSVLGAAKTISATGMAANPFINIGNAITATIGGSATYADSIWIYPLLLDANGNPDFTTNQGAVPGLTSGNYPADASPSGCSSVSSCGSIGTPAGSNCTSNPTQCGNVVPSGCTDNPMQFTCGNFTMLANTYYNTVSNPCPASSPCYPNGAGTYPAFIQGVVQNPQAPPTIITATTPIGIAYVTIAGGSQSYGNNPYTIPANGCFYPWSTVYATGSQVYGNALNNVSGGNPGLDWPKVTHWFYSSYLLNGYAPSQGEILSQNNLLTYTYHNGTTIRYNTRIPSAGINSALGFTPTLSACATPQANGDSYDQFLTTTYPSTGATNASLYILKQPANSAYIPPASTGYSYQTYTPAATPGYQYAGLSCQAYGNNIFTFYWNDMGGRSYDDIDYNNGTVRIACNGPSFVILID